VFRAILQDIVSYTSLAQQCEPEDIMNMLHTLFSRFDALCKKHGVFKVETIGKCRVGKVRRHSMGSRMR
jgi:class 3 adenylate cyclase